MEDILVKVVRRGKKSKKQCQKVAVNTSDFPVTYLVLRFAPGLDPQALQWLANKIRGPRVLGGAELLLRRQPLSSPTEGVMMHVSATPTKLEQVAEELDLRSINKQTSPLSSSQQTFIVQHELLQGIRALPEDHSIPGYPEATLYHGQSIVEVYRHEGLLESLYPLHDHNALKQLGKTWYWTFFQDQPIEEIRQYFGDAVALYFCFLGFYTVALLCPTFLGLLQLFIKTDTLALCCVINVFWVILFLVMWKRKCNELAFSWGTIKMTGLDEPRPSFRGEMGRDLVTDLIQPQCPRYRTYLKMYLVSWPVALVCASVAFMVMLAAFWAEDLLILRGREMENLTGEPADPLTRLLAYVPSVVYTALVWVMNVYYRQLATFLTEWENHRTQAQFDRHRVAKLVVFEFVNNFMALFYIAFYIQDMEMLRFQLAIMLIVLQALNHFQEAIIPFLVLRYARKVTRVFSYSSWFGSGDKKEDSGTEGSSSEEDLRPLLKGKGQSSVRRRRPNSLLQNQDKTEEAEYAGMKTGTGVKAGVASLGATLDIAELHPDDPRIVQALEEGEREPYESTYDDYLEMFVQFGYVILFSPIYPAAALCAVVHNLLEVRADAFKLCWVTQRPLPKRVKDVGAWQRAFEAVGVISVATNCALLGMMPGLKDLVAPEASLLQWALMVGALEHALFTLGLMLYIAVPAQPEWVRVGLARIHHQSQMVLKRT